MKNREIAKKLGIKFISMATMMTLMAASLAGCGNATVAETAVEVNIDEESDTLQKIMETQAGKGHTTNGNPAKEEIVYVLADANGQTDKVIVSDWLKNTEAGQQIADVTNLTDIENVSGDEQYTVDANGNITWNANGNDIHYQGTTDAELPVDVKLTYYLDGQEIAPAELAGKSGKVTIRFDYTNNEKRTVAVNGKEKEIYVPFTMMSGAILDSAHFSNIEVTNGRIIDSGSNAIVIGMAFPGLADSLETTGIKDKLDSQADADLLNEKKIPEYVEITADVVDFTMNQTMTMAMSDVLSSLNLDSELDIDTSGITDSMDELTGGVDKLAAGSQRLHDGSTELSNGAKTLADKTKDLDDGAGKLLEGAGKIDSGAGELADGIGKVDDGVGSLLSGAGRLNDGAGSLKAGADKLKKGTGELAAAAPGLVSGANELITGSTTLGTGLNDLKNGASQLYAAADAAYKMTYGASWMSYGQGGSMMNASIESAIESVGDLSDNMKQDINEYANLAAQYESEINSYEGILAADRESIEALLAAPSVENVEVVVGSEELTGEYTYVTSTTVNNYYMKGETVVGEDGEIITDGDYSLDSSDSTEETETGTFSYTQYTTADKEIYSYDADAIMGAVDKYAADYQEYSNILASYTAYTQIMNYLSTYSGTVANVQADLQANGMTPDAQYYLSSVCKGLYGLTANDGTGVSSIDKLIAGNGQITNGMTTLKTGAEAAVAGVNALNNGAGELAAGAATLQSGTGELAAGVGTLKNGTGELVAGAGTLKSGTGELTAGAAALKDGTNQFKEGAGTLYEGTLTLEDGTKELMDGMFKFKSEGIDKLTELFGDDVQDVVDTLNAVLDAGNEYNIFSAADSSVDSSVKFVYKTDAIK